MNTLKNFNPNTEFVDATKGRKRSALTIMMSPSEYDVLQRNRFSGVFAISNRRIKHTMLYDYLKSKEPSFPINASVSCQRYERGGSKGKYSRQSVVFLGLAQSDSRVIIDIKNDGGSENEANA